MLALLNWRMWAAGIFLAMLPLMYVKGRLDGGKIANAEHANDVVVANAEARRLEQRRQSMVVEAGAAAGKREAALRADAARARVAVDGVRDELSAIRDYAAQSAAAAAKSVAALSNVFQQCSRRYSELAEIADRHANDSLMYQQSWPTDSPKGTP